MAEVSAEVVRFDRLWSTVDVDRSRYSSAVPFAHIVLDDVLDEAVMQRACAEFPPVAAGGWTTYLHVNERKYANPNADSWDETLRAIAEHLTSDPFVAYLEELTGHEHLLADWSMDGGGLHQSVRGGYLNLHADFTAHHTKPTWRRKVNTILYLNLEWHEEWGGDLELWSTDRRECIERISPIGNRLVVFDTDEHSYHGHPDPMTCPDHVGRQSMALYYFQEQESPLRQATDYRARPDDGMKSAAIYLDKKLLGAYDVLKRRLHLGDGAASRAMGAVDRIRSRSRR